MGQGEWKDARNPVAPSAVRAVLLTNGDAFRERYAREGRKGGQRGGTMISHRHRCIYANVSKYGRTTLRNWFLQHGRHSFRP